MKTFLKTFFLELVSGFIFGVLGLFLGAFVGGTFGFFSFGDLDGYEAGGVFFLLIGLSFGGVFKDLLSGVSKEQAYRRADYGWPSILFVSSVIVWEACGILDRGSFRYLFTILQTIIPLAVWLAVSVVIALRSGKG